MEHPEERYYKLNRLILSVIGLWPYQNKWSAHFARITIIFLTISSLFFQMLSIFTSDVNMDFVVEFMTTFAIIGGVPFQLCTRIIHIDKFKKLFDHMWNDWAQAKTDGEIKIMHQYAKTSKLLTIYYSLLMSIVSIIYVVWIVFIPNIHIISPVNRSHLQLRQLHMEFYIDKERYSYLIMFYVCITIFLTLFIYLGHSSLCLILMRHVCGMCDLLGYRAEHLFYVFEDTTKRDLNREKKTNRENIAVLVQLHYNVIQFVNMVETCHTLPFLLDLIGVVSAISVVLVQILTISENIERACLSISIMIVVLFYVFVPNYMGQKVTDMNSSIYEKVYNSAWYNADVSQQRSVLQIMNQRFHPLVLTACKFYPLSLPSFNMIIQMAISYCMFMRHL